MRANQFITEGRVKELAQDLKDKSMSDAEFEKKYGKTRTEVRAMLRNQSDSKLTESQIYENLRNWFKQKWVRFGPDGKIRGDCARGDDSEGKPKCLPQSKAHSLGKKGRASAASRKRREDPNPERSGKAINVDTKKKSNKGVTEGGFKNMYAEFSGYGNYMQGRAVNVFNKAGLEIVSKEYSEDDNIQTYVVKGDRWAIEKAGKFLERNAEQFGGYHFVKLGMTENYPKHQDLSGISTDKLKAYLARQGQQSVPGEGSQVKRVQAELQRRSRGVTEGAVKELSSDLKTMSDQEFQNRYKMTKAQARANLKKKDESLSEIRGFRGVGGARSRENDENTKIDAMLAKQDQQRRDYEKSGNFWIKRKDTQQHISDAFVGKAAANAAALVMLKQQPELRGNIVITAYGPGESQGVAEGSDHSLKKVWDRYSKHLMAAQGHHPDVRQIYKSGDIVQNIRKYVKDHHGQKAVDDMERYAEKHKWDAGVTEGMLDNPGEQDSPVAQAIVRRILLQRTDLLAKYGPEKVGAAVDEVADFVGDVDEIGSSDVSGWVRHVEQMLGNMQEGELDEAKLNCWSGYTRVKGVPAGAPGSCKKKTNEASSKKINSDAVRRIQQLLNKKFNANLDVDGVLGPLTVKSIKKFLPKSAEKAAPNPEKTTAVQGSEIKEEKCPECGGPMFSNLVLAEKQDACYNKVKSRYKVWPSAYASGALVQCRKKGAANWGNSSKKNESVQEDQLDEKWTKKYKDSINCSNPKGFSQRAHCAGRNKNEDVAEGEKIGGHYDPEEFDAIVDRLKKMAAAGPMKTVWDPNKRVYRNVPTAVQPTQQPKKK
jgi:hypothetical protein